MNINNNKNEYSFVNDIISYININFFKIFIIGLIIYSRFIIFNALNPDSISERENLYLRGGFAWPVSLGRYGLPILGKLILDYRVSPYLFQVLTVLIMSIITLLISYIFFKNSKYCMYFVSIILFSSNNFSQILTYNNQSLFYIIAYLLVIISFVLITERQNIVLLIVSILITCFSLSIYQAFIVASVCLCAFKFLSDCITNCINVKRYIYYLIWVLGSVIIYFISLKFIVLIVGENIINNANIGTITFKYIINKIIACYIDFYNYYFTNNIIYNTFLYRFMFNIIIFIFILFVPCFLFVTKKIKLYNLVLSLITILIYPICIFLCEIIFGNNRSIYSDTGNLIMPCLNYLYIISLYLIILILNDTIISKQTIYILYTVILFIFLFYCSVFQDCILHNMDFAKATINRIYVDSKEFKFDKICVIGNINYGLPKHYQLVKGTIATYGITWKTDLYYRCLMKFAKEFNYLDFNYIDYNEIDDINIKNDIKLLPNYPTEGYLYCKDKVLYIKLGDIYLFAKQ